MAQPSRRDVLGGAAALAGGWLLAGCSSSGSGSGPGGAAAGTTAAASTPGTGAGAGAWKLTDIEHVVILMQENRSFDMYFGTRPGVRGFADPDVLIQANGKPLWYQPTDQHPDGYILPFHVRSLDSAGQALGGSNHLWQGMHASWNGGKLDGFAKVNGPRALPYYRRVDIPYYWALADHFTLCDRFFCSVMGPTLPNRHMAMTGTIDPRGTGGGPVVDNNGKGFRWDTYPERLQKAGVSWRIYHEQDDYDDNVVKYYQRYLDAKPGDPLYDNAIANRTLADFTADVASGNLPQVSWIVAPEAKSEHPIWAPALGEDYTAGFLGALLANPKVWAKTAFILTYDETDGAFDHVPPPVPAPGTPDEWVTIPGGTEPEPIGCGGRIPTIIVSPFARARSDKGRVASQTFDHTSVLRFLETRFGVEVPNLSAWRRETMADLTVAFDLATPPDPSVPSLPDTKVQVEKVSAAINKGPLPQIPSPQAVPTLDP